MIDAAPVRRRVLGAALRRFREQADYTLDDAARILNCGRFKISRIGTGQRGIRATELQELLAEYGVDELRRDVLLSLAHKPRQDGWCNLFPRSDDVSDRRDSHEHVGSGWLLTGRFSQGLTTYCLAQHTPMRVCPLFDRCYTQTRLTFAAAHHQA